MSATRWYHLFIGKCGLARARLGHGNTFVMVPVKVLGARWAYGRVMLQCQPIHGEGCAWVDAKNTQIMHAPKPGDEIEAANATGNVADAAARGESWAQTIVKRFNELKNQHKDQRRGKRRLRLPVVRENP